MGGHVFHPGHEELHGVTVVVNGATGKTYVGRYHERNERGVVLKDVAIHEPGNGLPLEEWLDRQRKFGVRVDERALVVPGDEVVDVGRLDEGRETRDEGACGVVPFVPRPSSLVSAVYDSPCHLQHAQGIIHQPLALLSEVPGLTLLPLADSEKCCGSAGIFSLLEPGMSQAVLDAKLDAILACDPVPDLVLTGNPGCLMQIGAGLRARRSSIRTAHPVELLGPRRD